MHRPQRDDRAQLAACRAEVALARSLLQEARTSGTRQEIAPLRERLVAALEEFASLVERSGAPLPQHLHAELQMYRRLGSH
ncbi:hypothetical protein ACJ5H2_07005 [Nocardioides sp. R1-1]|uniref:hypothetical protein n=1 Tax=Nocardioides sp. R1-1 TaxID=3383502 RepID=UPI0038CFFAFD